MLLTSVNNCFLLITFPLQHHTFLCVSGLLDGIDEPDAHHRIADMNVIVRAIFLDALVQLRRSIRVFSDESAPPFC